MKKEEITILVRASVVIAIITLVIYFSVLTSAITTITLYRASSFALTVVVGFWTLYFTLLWRYSAFNWILYRPDIRGTWGGLLTSNWIGPNGHIEPKPFFIVIHQNFLNLKFTTFTDNFMGISYSENVLFDENRNRQKVVYLYMKDTSDIGIQEKNEGVTELRIIGRNPSRMEGRYWTNINTKGTIEVTLISREYVESFSDCFKLFQQ